MAINKKLIHFEKRENFNARLANNEINDTSIVFIQDTGELWTHGLFFCTTATNLLEAPSLLTVGDTIAVQIGDKTSNYIVPPAALKGRTMYECITDTADTRGHWTGTIPGVTELYDGLVIHVRFTTTYYGNSEGYNTLNINNLGPKLVWYRYGSILTTHWGSNAELTLTYRTTAGSYKVSNAKGELTNGTTYTDGWVADYAYYTYSDRFAVYYYFRFQVPSTANGDEANGYIGRYMLVMRTPNNKATGLTLTNNSTATTKSMYAGPLLLGEIYYYNNTNTYAAGANFTHDAYMRDNSGLVDFRYTFNCGSTLTAYKPMLLVGTMSNGYFYMDTTQPWTLDWPSTEDGKVYILIGQVYDTYRGELSIYNPAYVFKNGKLQLYSQYAAETEWANIIGKPSTFTPSTHTHPYTDLTGSTTTADLAIVSSGTANGWTLKTLGSHAFDSTAYLPLAGGTMTGPINWGTGSTREVLLFSTNSTWKAGLRYSWNSNTTVALWGKHKNIQFVWNAGADSELNGTTTKTYDFLIGRDTSGTYNDTVVGRIAGNIIWHAGNDGSDSGLDADLLDGYHIGSLFNVQKDYTYYDIALNDTNNWFCIGTINSPYNYSYITIHVSGLSASLNNIILLKFNNVAGWSFNNYIYCGTYTNTKTLTKIGFYRNGANDLKLYIYLANTYSDTYQYTGYRINLRYNDLAFTPSTPQITSESAINSIVTLTYGNYIYANLVGNASTATKWQNARTLTIGNKGQSVDGSSDVTWTLADIGAASSTHTHAWNSLTRTSTTAGQVIVSTSTANGWELKTLGSNAFNSTGYLPLTGGTLSGNLAFSHGSSTTDQFITWASGTHYQRLKVRDGLTDVFVFLYSTDSGATWLDYFTIRNGSALIGTNAVLDASNYTTYTVKKDGTGATGTWGIGITGNAGTATEFASNQSVTLTGDTTGTASSLAGWSIATTTKYLTGTSSANYELATTAMTTAMGNGKVTYYYKLTNNTTGLFAATSNANSIFAFNKHDGSYDSQLGFSSNGNIYYRNFANVAPNTTQAWKQIAFTDSNITGQASYAANVGSAGTLGTNYVAASKVIAACNWYDTVTGSDTDSVINRWDEIVNFVAGFEETPDLATYLSNNYLAKTGNSTASPMTGTIYFKDVNPLVLLSTNQDLDIWRVTGNTTGSLWDNTFGFYLRYNGTGSANDNTLSLWANNQTSSDVEVYRIKLNGILNFLKAPTINGTAISLSGHTHYIGTTSTSDTSAAGKDLTGIGTVYIQGTQSAYREGIRIKPYNSWSTIVLGGTDLTADSGTSAKTWSILNNDGNFYITKNGSSTSSTAILSNVSNNWTFGKGTVTVSNAFTASAAVYLKGLEEGSADITDDTELVTSYAGPSGFANTTGAGRAFRRKATKLYNYIKGKTDDLYVTLNTAQTISGIKTLSNHSYLRFDAPANTVISSLTSSNILSYSPLAWNSWHDHFAMLRTYTITSVEYSTDGSTWNNRDLSLKPLFIHKETSNVNILRASDLAFRFVMKGTLMHACQIAWIVLGINYSTPFSATTLTIEYSSDATTWTQWFTGSLAIVQTTSFLKVSDLAAYQLYIRFTFTKTSNLTTGTVSLNSISGLTKRKGDQGLGREYLYPYSWNENLDIYPIITDTQDLGTSSYQWNNLYAKTIYQNGSSINSLYVTSVDVTDDTTNHANQLRYVKNGVSTYFTVPYATNADTVDGYHETSFFRARGLIDTSYVDLTTYTANAEGYINPKNGMWSVPRGGYSEGLVTFTGSGSTSGLDLWFHYAKGNFFKFRRRIDSNRVSGAWETFITDLNYTTYCATKSHNHNDLYVTSVGVTDDTTNHANLLRYVKNGTSTYFTVPFATNSTNATTASNARQLLSISNNEVCIGATATPADATNSNVWINYRSGYGGTTSDDATQITAYFFGNRKGDTTGVTLYATTFNGNATSATKANNLNKSTLGYLYLSATTTTGSTGTVTATSGKIGVPIQFYGSQVNYALNNDLFYATVASNAITANTIYLGDAIKSKTFVKTSTHVPTGASSGSSSGTSGESITYTAGNGIKIAGTLISTNTWTGTESLFAELANPSSYDLIYIIED